MADGTTRSVAKISRGTDMRLTMRSNGIAEAQGKLSNMRARVANLHPVLKVGARRIDNMMKNCFRESTGPDGVKWAPLQKSTIDSRATKVKDKKKKKAIRGGKAKILVDSGRLKDSMFARAKQNAIEFGSNVGYLAPHQLGGKEIPRRLIAPVVKRGGFWTLVDRGPAKAVFYKIQTELRKFITR